MIRPSPRSAASADSASIASTQIGIAHPSGYPTLRLTRTIAKVGLSLIPFAMVACSGGSTGGSTPDILATMRARQAAATPAPTQPSAIVAAVQPSPTAPPTSVAAAATPRPPTATPKPAGIGPGIYQVGKDIPPGTYQSAGGTAGGLPCYWARLSGLGGTLKEIVANNLAPTGQQLVTILATDAGFDTNGCAPWVRVP